MIWRVVASRSPCFLTKTTPCRSSSRSTSPGRAEPIACSSAVVTRRSIGSAASFSKWWRMAKSAAIAAAVTGVRSGSTASVTASANAERESAAACTVNLGPLHLQSHSQAQSNAHAPPPSQSVLPGVSSRALWTALLWGLRNSRDPLTTTNSISNGPIVTLTNPNANSSANTSTTTVGAACRALLPHWLCARALLDPAAEVSSISGSNSRERAPPSATVSSSSGGGDRDPDRDRERALVLLAEVMRDCAYLGAWGATAAIACAAVSLLTTLQYTAFNSTATSNTSATALTLPRACALLLSTAGDAATALCFPCAPPTVVAALERAAAPQSSNITTLVDRAPLCEAAAARYWLLAAARVCSAVSVASKRCANYDGNKRWLLRLRAWAYAPSVAANNSNARADANNTATSAKSVAQADNPLLWIFKPDCNAIAYHSTTIALAMIDNSVLTRAVPHARALAARAYLTHTLAVTASAAAATTAALLALTPAVDGSSTPNSAAGATQGGMFGGGGLTAAVARAQAEATALHVAAFGPSRSSNSNASVASGNEAERRRAEAALLQLKHKLITAVTALAAAAATPIIAVSSPTASTVTRQRHVLPPSLPAVMLPRSPALPRQWAREVLALLPGVTRLDFGERPKLIQPSVSSSNSSSTAVAANAKAVQSAFAADRLSFQDITDTATTFLAHAPLHQRHQQQQHQQVRVANVGPAGVRVSTLDLRGSHVSPAVLSSVTAALAAAAMAAGAAADPACAPLPSPRSASSIADVAASATLSSLLEDGSETNSASNTVASATLNSVSDSSPTQPASLFGSTSAAIARALALTQSHKQSQIGGVAVGDTGAIADLDAAAAALGALSGCGASGGSGTAGSVLTVTTAAGRRVTVATAGTEPLFGVVTALALSHAHESKTKWGGSRSRSQCTNDDDDDDTGDGDCGSDDASDCELDSDHGGLTITARDLPPSAASGSAVVAAGSTLSSATLAPADALLRALLSPSALPLSPSPPSRGLRRLLLSDCALDALPAAAAAALAALPGLAALRAARCRLSAAGAALVVAALGDAARRRGPTFALETLDLADNTPEVTAVIARAHAAAAAAVATAAAGAGTSVAAAGIAAGGASGAATAAVSPPPPSLSALSKSLHNLVACAPRLRTLVLSGNMFGCDADIYAAINSGTSSNATASSNADSAVGPSATAPVTVATVMTAFYGASAHRLRGLWRGVVTSASLTELRLDRMLLGALLCSIPQSNSDANGAGPASAVPNEALSDVSSAAANAQQPPPPLLHAMSFALQSAPALRTITLRGNALP